MSLFLKFISSLERKNLDKPVVSKLKKDPFKILISTILSARTRDETLERVLPNFFKKIKNFKDLEKIDIYELEELIRPIGFYREKSKKLKELAKIIINQYNGEIPVTKEELMKLPGVGLKTATLFLILVKKDDEVCVDTHVHRITNRWFFVNTKNPEETYFEIKKKVPPEKLKIINDLLVSFGKKICTPINPKCEICEYKMICPYFMKLSYFYDLLNKYEFKEGILNNGGTYVLHIYLKENRKIKFGNKEKMFKKGNYFYVGSAKNGLKQRINHHLLKNKEKKHWHIDYLLEYGKIKRIYTSNRLCEKELCKELTVLEYINGFGNSDDKENPSHLFYLPS